MKTIILLTFLLPFCSYAQYPHWNAKFIVTNPDGLTDTMIIGCNADAETGYNKSMDSLSVDFLPPVAIRSFDPEVENKLKLGTCVNLKTDIRNFVDGGVLEFILFVLTDDYPDADNFTISWDTTDLKYNESGLRLTYAWFESEGGYINGIDATEFYFLFVNTADGDTTDTFLQSTIPLFPFDVLKDCSGENWAMKIRLFIAFNLFPTDIEGVNVNLNLYPNPAQDFLIIDNKLAGSLMVEIYDVNGRFVSKNEVYFHNYTKLDIRSLIAGIYFVKFIHPQSGQCQVFKLIKA